MALIAKDNTFTPMPGGFHKARLVSVADCGTQTSEKYGASHKVWLGVEALVDGESATAGKLFTLSLNEKSALLPVVEALLGRELTKAEQKAGVDIYTLVGKACGIEVESRVDGDKTTTSLKSFRRLDGDPPPAATRTAVFDLDSDTELPSELPRFVCDMIRKAPEWKGEPAAPAPKALADDLDPNDDIPF